MRSFIILEIEHEDDITLLSEWCENISPTPMAYPELTIMDYAVRVDLPPFMHGVSINAIIDRGIGLNN